MVGSGEFGEVWRGKIVEGKNKAIDVAVKKLKDGIGIVDQTNFLKEACTMAQFNHPNIIELKGVVTKSQYFTFQSSSLFDLLIILQRCQR